MSHTIQEITTPTSEQPIAHIWREAPPAQGCKTVCKVCGCKDFSKDAALGCVETVPTTKPLFSRPHNYDPYEQEIEHGRS